MPPPRATSRAVSPALYLLFISGTSCFWVIYPPLSFVFLAETILVYSFTLLLGTGSTISWSIFYNVRTTYAFLSEFLLRKAGGEPRILGFLARIP